MKKEKEELTTAEAGRIGGEKVAEERGSEFNNEIGSKGAEAEPREAKVRGGKHSHMGSESKSRKSESTHEKLFEARRKGAEAQPMEAKRKGGEHSHKNE
jgi:hypothetical protein